MADELVIAGRAFRSRLIVGTGKYRSFPEMARAIEASGADICVGERTLFGCYSASVDLQAESAHLVFSGELPVEELISHRFPLVKIRSGFHLALHPEPKSLKIIVQPQRWS